MMRGEIVRPGEFIKDGVIGSPDLVNLQTNRVIETKATWRSSQKFERLEKFFWAWLVQMKGYCKFWDTREVELYVYFINGDYRGSGPQPVARLFTFSQMEIDGNWEMLLKHADKRGWRQK